MVGCLTALPAFTTDMYLTALPQLAADFEASDSAAQATLSIMLIGAAIGTLVMGPLTDQLGRKRPLLIGLAGHIVTSLLCLVAESIEVLLVLRLLQGAFNATMSVVAMAVVRDRFTGAEAARVMSRLMLMIGLSPLLAPALGAWVASLGSWRAIFAVLVAMGVLVACLVIWWMPETLEPERRTSRGLSQAPAAYLALLKDPIFVVLALVPALSFAVLMTYVVGSPFVFQDGFGLSAGQFSALFALNGLALVVSAQVNASVVHRFPLLRILRFGLLSQVIIIGAMLVSAIVAPGAMVALMALLFVAMLTQGFTSSNAGALAMSRHGERAGTASAVIGAFQTGMAGLVSPVVGVLGSGPVAMSGLMFGAALCALALVPIGMMVRKRAGEPGV